FNPLKSSNDSSFFLEVPISRGPPISYVENHFKLILSSSSFTSSCTASLSVAFSIWSLDSNKNGKWNTSKAGVNDAKLAKESAAISRFPFLTASNVSTPEPSCPPCNTSIFISPSDFSAANSANLFNPYLVTFSYTSTFDILTVYSELTYPSDIVD